MRFDTYIIPQPDGIRFVYHNRGAFYLQVPGQYAPARLGESGICEILNGLIEMKNLKIGVKWKDKAEPTDIQTFINMAGVELDFLLGEIIHEIEPTERMELVWNEYDREMEKAIYQFDSHQTILRPAR